MGRQATKPELFVSISLDEYVPEDHLLRAVDRYLDLREFRGNLAVSYSHTGRPSIDSELIARMLIIGYCYGTRSERRLCEEVSMNLVRVPGLPVEAEVLPERQQSKNRP